MHTKRNILAKNLPRVSACKLGAEIASRFKLVALAYSGTLACVVEQIMASQGVKTESPGRQTPTIRALLSEPRARLAASGPEGLRCMLPEEVMTFQHNYFCQFD